MTTVDNPIDDRQHATSTSDNNPKPMNYQKRKRGDKVDGIGSQEWKGEGQATQAQGLDTCKTGPRKKKRKRKQSGADVPKTALLSKV
jgi:hypothetical protein